LKIGDCIGQKQRITPQGVIKIQEDLISAPPRLFGTREYVSNLRNNLRHLIIVHSSNLITPCSYLTSKLHPLTSMNLIEIIDFSLNFIVLSGGHDFFQNLSDPSPPPPSPPTTNKMTALSGGWWNFFPELVN
jgi:hypothetical protein